MDLIYKISGAYLYDNQLNHDYLFFFNRKKDYFGNYLNSDADYYMFGSSESSASTKIYRMDKNDPNFLQNSIDIMLNTAKESGVFMIKTTDFITLEPIAEGRVSYGPALPGDKVELDGLYKGLKKSVYTPYNILWNETKSGINVFDWEIAGVWNPGQSFYSKIRLFESKDERESTIRDNKLKKIGIWEN